MGEYREGGPDQTGVTVAGSSTSSIFERARQDFPGVIEQTHLDVASCAPISRTVQIAVTRHLTDPAYGFDKESGLVLVEQTRSLFAQLINAQPDEVAFTKNVSEGLNFIANAIDWKTGDNIVICPAMEHPNNRYLWHQLAHRLGLELILVPADGNEYPLDTMMATINSRTRLVALSSVSYVPGFLTPLEPLAQICRRRGIFFLVDAAQSVGPLHTDVQSTGVDAMAVSTQKGLLGLYGMGFLYVRSEWAQRLQPSSLGRFGVDEASVTGNGMAREPLVLRRGARRFDLGNHNLTGAVAAKESLTLLTGIGTEVIQRHTIGLAKSLAAELIALGLPVCMPFEKKNQAHIVSLGSLYPPPAEKVSDFLFQFHQYLVLNRVRASWRNGILRFSTHLYNDDSDIQRVINLAKNFIGNKG